MLEVNNSKELFMDTVLRNYGIETRKTNREYRSFIDVVNDISKKWENLSEEQQKALINTVFGITVIGKN